jgi:hypothetical protein
LKIVSNSFALEMIGVPVDFDIGNGHLAAFY